MKSVCLTRNSNFFHILGIHLRSKSTTDWLATYLFDFTYLQRSSDSLDPIAVVLSVLRKLLIKYNVLPGCVDTRSSILPLLFVKIEFKFSPKFDLGQ